MAKFFKTVEGCFRYIKKNAETGKEKEVNESLHFGMGLYAWSDHVTYSGVPNQTKTNEVFYHFKSDDEIIRFIKYLLTNDGYLYINN